MVTQIMYFKMYNRFKSKYDEYGKLKTEPWPEIKKDDRVGFVTTIFVNVNNKKKKKKIQLFGYWDGEKVEFNDKDKHIVRTKRWLTNENVF